MDTLRIGHGNIFAGNRHLRRAFSVIRESDCDSLDLAEGYRAVRLFGRLAGYRSHVGPTRDARDVPLLVNNRNPYVGHLTFKVSDALEQFHRVGKERHVNVAVYEWDGVNVAHIALHPVAGHRALTGTDPRHPLVLAYSNAVRSTADVLGLCQAQGWWLVLGSDRQVRPGDPVRPWSLQPVLEDRGMRVVADDGLDVLAVDRRLELVAPAGRIGIQQTGSDSHTWLVAELRKVMPDP